MEEKTEHYDYCGIIGNDQCTWPGRARLVSIPGVHASILGQLDLPLGLLHPNTVASPMLQAEYQIVNIKLVLGAIILITLLLMSSLRSWNKISRIGQNGHICPVNGLQLRYTVLKLRSLKLCPMPSYLGQFKIIVLFDWCKNMTLSFNCTNF